MVREWPYASYVALTQESIDLALAHLEADELGVTIASDTSSNADSSSDELARLFSVVETANSGFELHAGINGVSFSRGERKELGLDC